jgi:hypothetical protein
MRLSYLVASGRRALRASPVRVSGAGFSHRFPLKAALAAAPGLGFQVVDVGQCEPGDLVLRPGVLGRQAEAGRHGGRDYYPRAGGDGSSERLPGLRSRSQIVSWTREEMRSLA